MRIKLNNIEQIDRASTNQKVNKFKIILGLVAILIILTGLCFFIGIGKSPEVLRAEKKTELLKMVNNANVATLTEKQKIEILNAFGGSNTEKYNFTAEEREQILRALNGK